MAEGWRCCRARVFRLRICHRVRFCEVDSVQEEWGSSCHKTRGMPALRPRPAGAIWNISNDPTRLFCCCRCITKILSARLSKRPNCSSVTSACCATGRASGGRRPASLSRRLSSLKFISGYEPPMKRCSFIPTALALAWRSISWCNHRQGGPALTSKRAVRWPPKICDRCASWRRH